MSTQPPLIDKTPALSVIDGPLVDPDLEEDQQIERRILQVPAILHGERLDKALASLLGEFSRSHLQHLIAQGDVSDAQGQALIKPSTRVSAGVTLQVSLRPTEESLAYTPEDMPLTSVYCDEHLRVILKPAGLVVHPAPGHWRGTLLNGLLALDPKARALPRAGIVHRLDKDTSGLMMVARSRPAMDALVQAIAERRVKREYLALVQGRWPHTSLWSLEGAIGRDPKNRLRMAVLADLSSGAKPAQTLVEPLVQGPAHALLHCRLQTGRTHQIRVHLAHAGFPLVGDELYGGKAWGGMHRQALHAWRLSLRHPITQAELFWTVEPPADMAECLTPLGLGYNFGQ
jgi:23S rRNA pseudouridine1911/1915/1917 synthase